MPSTGTSIFGVTGTFQGATPTHGSQSWTTPGTYYWTVPSGVSGVLGIATGGGGGGGYDINVGGGGGWQNEQEDITLNSGDYLTLWFRASPGFGYASAAVQGLTLCYEVSNASSFGVWQ